MSGPWIPPNPPNYRGNPSWEPRRRWWIFPAVVVGVVLVILVAFLVWFALDGPGTGANGGYAPRGWFFFPFGFLILLFVLFMIIRIAFWSVRWGRGGGGGGRRYGPNAILRARYARGEITREQYLQMQRDLNDSR
jgi:putative membrane protein